MPGLFSAIALLIKQLTLLVSYVKNNAFPQLLTEEEEEKHLREVVYSKRCSFVGQADMFPYSTHVENLKPKVKRGII